AGEYVGEIPANRRAVHDRRGGSRPGSGRQGRQEAGKLGSPGHGEFRQAKVSPRPPSARRRKPPRRQGERWTTIPPSSESGTPSAFVQRSPLRRSEHGERSTHRERRNHR